MNIALCELRFKNHIAHAKTLFTAGDYVQASEKIWGALSAIITLRRKREIRSMEDKRKTFLGLFNNYYASDATLRTKMHRLGFRRDEEVFYAIFGLHSFFYGGQNFTDQQLSQRIPFLIQVVENL
jgi:hypothetical protein